MQPAQAGIKVLKEIAEVRTELHPFRVEGKTIGLVPTMGAIHDGHLALIERAREECDAVVVSLFVNPAQFSPGEDYKAYPRNFDADRDVIAAAAVDYLFAPETDELYPFKQLVAIDVDEVSKRLCGRSRPNYFSGVCTIVAKLFNIVQPDRAYFGEKDWQQLVVIRRMSGELNFPVEIVGVATVRDSDGLALSSRNQYLSEEERRQALVIPGALKKAAAMIVGGESDAEVVRKAMMEIIDAGSGIELEYLSICRPDDLIETNSTEPPLLIAIAAKAGKARLIDNILIGREEDINRGN